MLNKRFVIIAFLAFLAIILIVASALFFFDKDDDYSKKASVIANDVMLSTQDAIVFKEHAIVPLFETLQAFSVKIDWLDENNAEISYDAITMCLDLNEASLMKKGKNSINYLGVAPGSEHYYCSLENDEVFDGEIFIDNLTLVIILFHLGIKTEVDCDIDNEIITIRLRDD